MLTEVAGAATYRFVAAWGGPGTVDGTFDEAVGIARDPAGTLFVSDAGNRRVQAFSSDGGFIRKWGSPGSGDGEFATPHGIAVSPTGNVIVGDPSADRIQVFTETGAFVRKWGSAGTADGQFNAPHGIATDAAGNVFVADKLNHRIQVFTETGVFVRKWGTEGTGAGQFSSPHGIEVDADGNVLVVDAAERVQVFSATGSFLRGWRTDGPDESQSSSPRGIAAGPTGSVFVSDFALDRVQEFSSTGVFVRRWGSSGASGGQLAATEDLAVGPAGTVFTVGDNRVQTFVLSPEVTLTMSVDPVFDPGRFDLRIGDATVAAGVGHGGQGSLAVASGSAVTVSEVAHPGTPLADYDTTIDCGAGPQAATSVVLPSVTADTTCAITNRRRAPAPAPGSPAGPPLTPPMLDAPLLTCGGTSAIRILEVAASGRRVHVAGLALVRHAGQQVTITGGRRTVRTTIRPDGTFTVLAPRPRRPATARYRASVAGVRSPAFRFKRPFVLGVPRDAAGSKVRITGTIRGRAGRRRTVEIRRQATCTASQRVATVRTDGRGRLTVVLARPTGADALAVYRLRTKGRGVRYSLPVVVRR